MIRFNIKANLEGLQKRINTEQAQRFFTNESAKLMDSYIPFRQGDLKNNKTLTRNSITYEVPYARRQYWEHKGKGLRGPQWDKRMYADRKEELLNATAKILGGKVK